MDSLTQLVLGGCVGAAIAGRVMGPRRSAILGGLLGTLPDFDVFYPFVDPIDSFVLHRSVTHSLLIHSLAAPLLGWLLAVWTGLHRWRMALMVWFVWVTHALLDAMTIYGTQLLWPLSTKPFGTGSVFIIDPLYTLPLLGAFLAMLVIREWGRRIAKGVAVALCLSTLYLGWSLMAQNWAAARTNAWLGEKGLSSNRLLTTASPFNTLFWRTIVIDGADYLNVYTPLLGGYDDIVAFRHSRVDAAGACALATRSGRRLEAFAEGFVQSLRAGDRTIVSDLRMGITPNFVFNFIVADGSGEALLPATALPPQGRIQDGDWPWLLGGVLGTPGTRPAERAATITSQTRAARSNAPVC